MVVILFGFINDGCLAPLAPMVIPAASTVIITFNIFFVVILFLSKSEYK